MTRGRRRTNPMTWTAYGAFPQGAAAEAPSPPCVLEQAVFENHSGYEIHGAFGDRAHGQCHLRHGREQPALCGGNAKDAENPRWWRFWRKRRSDTG